MIFLILYCSQQYEPEEANNVNGNIEGERYIACYPYQSAEVGDLTFEVGEEMIVVKKEGDWWTGVIGSRTGMFPANYVQPITDNNTNTMTSAITNDFNEMNLNGSNQDQGATMSAEEAANQADADSEVSQINTQNVANDASMQEFRGMTSSAVRLNPHFLNRFF
jgi:intersectin